jgi:arginase
MWLDAIAAYSRDLADAVSTLLDGPGFPLVLGGDCSIALGVAMALRRRGRFGLVYLDAHSDCQTPGTSETGGVAGMPLTMITGRGPDLLTPLVDERPQVAESDVVLLGCRDLFDITTRKDESHVVGTRIRVRDLDEIRRAGPVAVAQDVLRRLSETGVEQLWIHLDVDVLDPVIMPAVDSPDPGGLTEEELVALLGELLAAPTVRGMHVTIYDPERDPDGSAGALLVRALTAALRVT